jgi:hypothetical protein
MQRLTKERFLGLVYEGLSVNDLLPSSVDQIKNFLKRNKSLSVEQIINKLRNNEKRFAIYENLLSTLNIYNGECIKGCWCEDDEYNVFCYKWLCKRFKYDDVRRRCIEILNAR